MKLFKKALVATAILGAFGAQAADLTDAVKSTSKQGVSTLGASDTSLRVIVREQLEAGDLVKLVFGEGTNISGLTVDVDGTPTNGALNIVYGSGTYTFSQHSSTDLTKNTLVLEVNTGDPVTKDSSFEVQVPAAGIVVAKASSATVTYSATSGLTGNPKDTSGDNVGNLIVLKDQYTASVKRELNAVLNRTNKAAIVSGGEDEAGASSTTKDVLVISVKDDDTLLSAIPANDRNNDATTTDPVVVNFKITGNFEDYANSEITAFDTAGTPVALTISNAAVNTAETEYSFDVNFANTVTKLSDIQLVFTGAANSTPAGLFNVDDYKVTASVTYGAGTTDTIKVIDGADAGEFTLDAAVINIPYFPVGYEGLSTSVHFANENSKAADVLVEAVDNKGVSYSGSIAALAAKSVTKVSQTALQAALKDKDGNTVPNETKLSVTFNIDADVDTVNAYAMSNEKGVARQQLANSQQKGVK